MSELEDRINEILGDAEQMDRIAEMARSLMGGDAASPPESGASAPAWLGELLPGGEDGPDPALLGRIGRLLRGAQTGDSRERALLEAMKPYLSEPRRSRMDRAMKLAHMAKLAQTVMGELGGDGDV